MEGVRYPLQDMCFFDQVMWTCGDWKWDRFRQHCNREYRTGETCGMKLVYAVARSNDKCKICQKIDTKLRRRAAEVTKIQRWQSEGSKLKASIERSYEIIKDLDQEIYQLQIEKQRKTQAIGKAR
ncbi:hypothetical protein D6D02_02350 [Aureobasidium pullulans]|uniref:Uncharacterized protein n=1 Tax=Aureobasidium pullulans TaxID=5580 RepID=A0A4S9F794_AURPU|nr:hypothetical protein D6D23_00449 [Aureobasidium pullulans]THW65277.1 hypothetical protein D6D20_02257 [Aureobasidium pullulans]THX43236.1 hypothetical protein D6D10_01324 [Aureobasidium pullulans]THY19454.1 hypothetical protein D6D02_02350 [Aureobasidium pullulans]THZ53608.1 hypothetical protein D6C90_00465 [Aureobasidium pullulans]